MIDMGAILPQWVIDYENGSYFWSRHRRPERCP
jgi:hypothetical protein